MRSAMKASVSDSRLIAKAYPFGALDENAAPDIAGLMRNIDQIRRLSGAHVMLVHHTGKDTGRGARGQSSLRAAIDTKIELPVMIWGRSRQR